KSMGSDPTLEEAYDPKSKEHILAGTYPQERDLVPEMEGMAEVLKKHGVKVFRPEVISDYNQIFSRDIAFVIDETFVVTQMLAERSREINALKEVISGIPSSQVVKMSGDAYLEGGDVMPHGDKIFVGYAKEPDFSNYTVARSNQAGIDFLKERFPNKTVHAFELNKSDDDPKANALHLDCCFQPLGLGHCIIHPEGFKNPSDVEYLMELFGKDNCFVISADEMYQMFSNVFSIAPNVVVSGQNFDRLNAWMEKQGYQVEKVKYQEISKMEGLLRCTTLPLKRTY
ncbi:MAG: arginine deiminase family protein, partial [Bacteroidota bacterium]